MSECMGFFDFFSEHWFLAFIAMAFTAGALFNVCQLLNNLIKLADNKRKI